MKEEWVEQRMKIDGDDFFLRKLSHPICFAHSGTGM